MMKIIVLYLLRTLGFFKISKALKRKKLIILAYHGVEIDNESSFDPVVFIKRSTFEQRIEYLKKANFTVLSLTEALHKLYNEGLPLNSLVITFDDGWYSTIHHADRILSRNDFPYTVYMTSYYVKHSKVPVLNVALRYMLWSCDNSSINLDLLAIPQLSGKHSLLDSKEKDELSKKLFGYFNSIKTIDQKIDFIKKIAALFEINYERIVNERNLGLLSFSELEVLSDQGVDIQLHTHRHKMPFDDLEKIEKEINENKAFLSPYVKNRLEHFCYPSGQYSPACESVLKEAGIKSATTCEPGLVTKQTNNYYLPRFLDGENVPQIVFEAELCGVLNFLRKIRFPAKGINRNYSLS